VRVHQGRSRHHPPACLGRKGPPAPPRRRRGCVPGVQQGLPAGTTLARPVRDLIHARRDRRQVSQIQLVLARRQPIPRRRQQQRQIGVRARRPQVLNLLHGPAPARDDLDRHRPGGSPDLAHEPRDHR
jgi:hypothetical protein